MFLDILNPPLDYEAIFSLCEKFNETSQRPACGNTWPRIIFFSLDNLIDFLKEYTQGFKEKDTRLKEKNP